MTEAIVVGGGLAGGAVATLLARAGGRVRLFEREAEPVDKICGEFLSIEAQNRLAHLGVDLDGLGASRIDTLRLVFGARRIETRLPFVARGLTRKRLDEALLERAAAAGARIERGVAVRSIAADRVATTQGDAASGLLLLASGKHEVRGAARRVEGCDNGYVGFKTYWRLSRRASADLAGKIDVILFEGGYAGLQVVEGGTANLCLLVTKARLAELGGTWSGVLAAVLRETHAMAILGDAEQCAGRPLTIAGVPYGYLHRGTAEDDLFRLGDQAAVIPSFCGEGMSITLHSAAVAAAVIAGGGNAAGHHAMLRRTLAPRLRVAMALQRASTTPWSRALIWHGMSLYPRIVDRLVQLTRIPAGIGGEASGPSPRTLLPG